MTRVAWKTNGEFRSRFGPVAGPRISPGLASGTFPTRASDLEKALQTRLITCEYGVGRVDSMGDKLTIASAPVCRRINQCTSEMLCNLMPQLCIASIYVLVLIAPGPGCCLLSTIGIAGEARRSPGSFRCDVPSQPGWPEFLLLVVCNMEEKLFLGSRCQPGLGPLSCWNQV